ncbi:hypothetical protein IVB27_21210 [Bradyrhizobium sp. 197]|jgi:hypothetical protein|uniref:hypothetical protein n=1 Tax=Bradyrhizobium sp. 197 TaxID=2782663 RepID=UPI001FFA0397|nr:hypothetical protein [Bradyrhizobium sp. 197]MCK1477251.1 hypothetical protein [Bradyrhizobium sp. 197]
MVSMSVHLLWTSADSLIVAFALAFIVPRWHVLPLILMFGVCDALGSALGVGVPAEGGLAAVALISCGALLVLRLPVAHRLTQAAGWVYVLPPLLAIDNVVSHAPDHVGLVALSSAAMAGLGFSCGAVASGWCNASLESGRSFAGTCLLVAGSVLAFGG